MKRGLITINPQNKYIQYPNGENVPFPARGSPGGMKGVIDAKLSNVANTRHVTAGWSKAELAKYEPHLDQLRYECVEASCCFCQIYNDVDLDVEGRRELSAIYATPARRMQESGRSFWVEAQNDFEDEDLSEDAQVYNTDADVYAKSVDPRRSERIASRGPYERVEPRVGPRPGAKRTSFRQPEVSVEVPAWSPPVKGGFVPGVAPSMVPIDMDEPPRKPARKPRTPAKPVVLRHPEHYTIPAAAEGILDQPV